MALRIRHSFISTCDFAICSREQLFSKGERKKNHTDSPADSGNELLEQSALSCKDWKRTKANLIRKPQQITCANGEVLSAPTAALLCLFVCTSHGH